MRNALNEHFGEFARVTDKKVRETVVDRLADQVQLLAAHIKHPSFTEEREHRIVVVHTYAGTSPLKFREGKSSLVPYLELPAPRALLKHVVIGPNVQPQLAATALDAAIETYTDMPAFIGDVKVTHSQIPYRTW